MSYWTARKEWGGGVPTAYPSHPLLVQEEILPVLQGWSEWAEEGKNQVGGYINVKA